MEYNFNEENINLVKKFIDIKNRGYYASGSQVTKVYNEVFNKSRATTNCGSCIRFMVSELERALNKWEAEEAKQAEIKALEALKQEDLATTKEEVKEAVTEQKKKRGRPKKS